MSTAKFFAYKGNVGVEIDPEGKFINDPFAAGELGAVISTAEIEMSKEAKDIINAADHEGGSFAQLMLTQHEGEGLKFGQSSIGIIGMGKVHLGSTFKIGRTCTKSVLEHCAVVQNSVPADYMEFIDNGGAE